MYVSFANIISKQITPGNVFRGRSNYISTDEISPNLPCIINQKRSKRINWGNEKKIRPKIYFILPRKKLEYIRWRQGHNRYVDFHRSVLRKFISFFVLSTTDEVSLSLWESSNSHVWYLARTCLTGWPFFSREYISDKRFFCRRRLVPRGISLSKTGLPQKPESIKKQLSIIINFEHKCENN